MIGYLSQSFLGNTDWNTDNSVIGKEVTVSHFSQETVMYDILWVAQRPRFLSVLSPNDEVALFCLTYPQSQSSLV